MLPNGRMRVPRAAESGPFLADMMVEIGPDDPEFDAWEAWFENHPGVQASALLAYSEDQPRDDHGRWTTGGSGGDNPYSGKATRDIVQDLRTKFPDTDFDFRGYGVEIPSENVAQLANAFDRNAQMYPEVPVRYYGTGYEFTDMNDPIAETRPDFAFYRNHDVASIIFNPTAIARADEFRAMDPKDWYSPAYRDNPDGFLGAMATHEYGHAVDIAYFGLKGAEVSDLDWHGMGGYAEAVGRREAFAEAYEMMVDAKPGTLNEAQQTAADAVRTAITNHEGPIGWGPGAPYPEMKASALLAYSEDQPRDSHGRWTSEGGGSAEGYTPAQHQGWDDPALQQLQEQFKNEPWRRPGEMNNTRVERVAAVQGYTGTPELLSKEEMDQRVAAGWTEVYRGFTQPEYEEQFKSGPYRAGFGLYGGGTYTAASYEKALSYTSEGDRLLLGTHDPDLVARMAINPDAKGVTYQDIVGHLQSGEAGDTGMWAAGAGYDYIVEPRDNTYIILNRTAVAVQDEPVQ